MNSAFLWIAGAGLLYYFMHQSSAAAAASPSGIATPIEQTSPANPANNPLLGASTPAATSGNPIATVDPLQSYSPANPALSINNTLYVPPQPPDLTPEAQAPAVTPGKLAALQAHLDSWGAAKGGRVPDIDWYTEASSFIFYQGVDTSLLPWPPPGIKTYTQAVPTMYYPTLSDVWPGIVTWLSPLGLAGLSGLGGWAV